MACGMAYGPDPSGGTPEARCAGDLVLKRRFLSALLIIGQLAGLALFYCIASFVLMLPPRPRKATGKPFRIHENPAFPQPLATGI